MKSITEQKLILVLLFHAFHKIKYLLDCHIKPVQQVETDPNHKNQISGNKDFGLSLPEVQAEFQLAMGNEPKPQGLKNSQKSAILIQWSKISSNGPFG